MSEEEIDIAHLGAHGDGVGHIAGERVFVPLALPGEIWRHNADKSAGNAWTCVAPLPDRVTPPCRHFPACGGCATQHMPEELYRTWKVGLVRQALHQQNISFEPADLILAGHTGRRRCVLSASKDRSGRVVLGYYRARSHDLIGIEECPVLVPAIVQALPGLRDLLDLVLEPDASAPAASAPTASARVTILQCEQGIDVDLSQMRVGSDPQHRAAVARLVRQHDLVRLSNNGDSIIMQAQPTVRLGKVSVPLPRANIFLQAVAKAELEICARVSAAVGKAGRVADLFCGAGSLTFDLARRVRVLAVDSEYEAISALQAGRDGAQGLKPIETLTRDLFKEPLSRKELDAFDAVVFDPPRAGAESQACMLAKSQVAVVVAVSCNPATLARDLSVLIDGGYRLQALQPIDQFLHSAHVECVAVLDRPNHRTRRRLKR